MYAFIKSIDCNFHCAPGAIIPIFDCVKSIIWVDIRDEKGHSDFKDTTEQYVNRYTWHILEEGLDSIPILSFKQWRFTQSILYKIQIKNQTFEHSSLFLPVERRCIITLRVLLQIVTIQSIPPESGGIRIRNTYGTTYTPTSYLLRPDVGTILNRFSSKSDETGFIGILEFNSWYNESTHFIWDPRKHKLLSGLSWLMHRVRE